MDEPLPETQREDYTRRLRALEGARWKTWLDVQAPYRWNLRRLRLGAVLDLGCGIGRNLVHLGAGSVGVDHNGRSVEVARARGCEAYSVEAFERSAHAVEGRFDSLLAAHVLEHMRLPAACALVAGYLRYLRPGGRVVLITPQEAGFRSDPTHVELMDFARLQRVLTANGLERERAYSFPFPRLVGRLFPHNEFVVVGRSG